MIDSSESGDDDITQAKQEQASKRKRYEVQPTEYSLGDGKDVYGMRLYMQPIDRIGHNINEL